MKNLELFSGETLMYHSTLILTVPVVDLLDPCLDFDLVDIWCIRNPDSTWRQRNPLIQRRLEKSDIIPSINSDHSANFLHFNSTETNQNTALLS